MAKGRKTGANPGRGSPRMSAPPKGSQLAVYVDCVLAADRDAERDYENATRSDLRYLNALVIADKDPGRPWEWPRGVYADALIRPRLWEYMGMEAADEFCAKHPAIIEYMEETEVHLLHVTSTQEERNRKPRRVTELAKGITTAALYDYIVKSNGQRWTENSLCEAVAKRLGPGISDDVVRRVYRQDFKSLWRAPTSDRTLHWLKATQILLENLCRIDEEGPDAFVRFLLEIPDTNTQKAAAP